MAKVTEVRLTLAAMIYAVEIDLKQLINEYITLNSTGVSFLKDKELEHRLVQRFQKENQGVAIESNIIAAVDYLDFQDCYTVILRNKELVPEGVYSEIKRLAPSLDNIVAIRNRVMHTRPLMSDDFPEVLAFVVGLRESSTIKWSTVMETLKKIEEDPSYVLTLSIPSFLYSKSHDTSHNLPLPDFDDTGFIGRKKDIEDVKKLILGANRVVSIIGDGGIGKTALALKVAYDILDLKENNPFDLIIWISAKTTTLTIKGIEDIESALRDFGGVIEASLSLSGSRQMCGTKSFYEYLST